MAQASAALLRLLDTSAERLQARALIEWIIEEDREHFRDFLGQCRRQADAGPCTVRVITANGASRHIEWRGTLCTEDQLLYGSGTDVTARVEAAGTALATLEARERQLRVAQHRAGLSVWEWEFTSGNIRFIGDMPPWLEGSADNCHLEALRARIHPEDRPQLADTARRLQAGETGEFNVKFRFLCNNGETRWFRSTGTPERAADGSIVRLTGATFDVTSIKQLEQELHERQAQLRIGQEVARMWSFAWDLRTDACSYTGGSPSPVGVLADGEGIDALLASAWPEDRPSLQAFLQSVRASPAETRQHEFRGQGPGGQPGTLLMRVRGEARQGGWLVHGACVDISELREYADCITSAQRLFRLWFWRCRVDTDSFEFLGDAAATDVPGGHRHWRLSELIATADPQCRQPLQAFFEQAWACTEPDREFQLTFSGSTDARAWYEARCRVLLDPTGKPVAVVGSTRDITRETLQGAALAEQDQHLRLAQESAGFWTWVVTPASGQVRYIGIPPPWAGPDTRADCLVEFEQHIDPDARTDMARQLQLAMANPGRSVELQLGVRWPDGSRHEILARGRALAGPDGQLLVYGTSMDVTDQVRAAEALRHSQQRFRRLIDLSPIAMCTISADGRVLLVNEAFTRFFQLPASSCIGSPTNTLTRPEDRAAWARAFGSLCSGDSDSFTLDKQYLLLDERTLAARVTAVAVRDSDGRLESVIAQIQDFSEIQERELEQRQSNALLTILERAHQAFHAEEPLPRIFASLLSKVLQLVGGSDGFIATIDEHRGEMQLEGTSVHRTTAGPEQTRAFRSALAPEEQIVRGIILQASPVLMNRVDEADTLPGLAGAPASPHNMLGMPLISGGRVAGVVVLCNREGGYNWRTVGRLGPFLNTAASLIDAARLRSERDGAIASLQHSEQRLHALIENLPGVVCHEEQDEYGRWRTVLMSAEVQALTGYTSEDFTSGRVSWWRDVVDPLDEARVRRNLSTERLQRHAASSCQYRIRTRSGRYRWVLHRVSAPLENQPVPACNGFIHDITPRHRMQNALELIARASSASGNELYQQIALAIAVALEVRIVIIAEPIARAAGEMRTLALVRDGKLLPAITYRLAGTPGQIAMREGVCFFQGKVRTRFPADALLRQWNVHSCVAARLHSTDARPLGIVAAMHDSDIDEASDPANMLEICSARIGSELQNIDYGQRMAGSLAALRATLESTADAILVHDRQGRILHYNSKYLELFELPEDALGNLREPALREIVYRDAEDREEVIAWASRMAAEALAQGTRKLRYPDGRVIECFTQPQLLAGRASGRVWSFRDITDTERSNALVRAERALLQEVLDSNPNIITVKDQQQRYVLVNKATADFTGMSPAQLLGRRLDEAPWHIAAMDQLMRAHETVLRTGRETRVDDVVARNSRGEERRLLVTNRPLRDLDGAVTRTLSVTVDATEIRDMESKLRQAVSELALAEERERKQLAVLLHDNIVQDLGALKLRLGIAQQQHHGIVELAQMRELTGQLITAARSLMFEISPPILYELGLTAALEWLAEQFQAKHGLSCQLQSDTAANDLPTQTQVMLFQVVRELLVNVNKHACASMVSVHMEADAEGFHLQVTDNGTGFNPARTEHGAELSGFGLFSIRDRLKLLGGELHVDSQPGRGTRVALTLPIAGAGPGG